MQLTQSKRRRSSILSDFQHSQLISTLHKKTPIPKVIIKTLINNDSIMSKIIENSIDLNQGNVNIQLVSKRFQSIYESIIYKDILIINDVNNEHINNNNNNNNKVLNKFVFLQLCFKLINNKSSFEKIESLSFEDTQPVLIFKSLSTKNTITESKSSYWEYKVYEILNENGIQIPERNIDDYLLNMNQYQVLSFILPRLTNLRKLSIPSMKLTNLCDLLKDNNSITDLTIKLTNDDQLINFNLNNVERLSIKFEKNTCKLFQKLSELINNKRLKELRLEFIKTEFNQSNDNLDWLELFNEQLQLQLTKLEFINVEISNKQESIADKLIKSINFQELKELKLGILETSHYQSSHFEINKSFINYLQPYLSNLEKLIIKPNKDCICCQFNNLVNFKIPLNLKSIDLEYIDYYNDFELKFIDNNNWKNLTNIRIIDEFKYNKFQNDFKIWLSSNEYNINELILFFRIWINEKSNKKFQKLFKLFENSNLIELNLFNICFKKYENDKIYLIDNNYKQIELFCYI